MFEAAIDFMTQYRGRRAKALRNEERARWFSADVTSMKALMEDKFGSDTENTEWDALQSTGNADFLKLQAIRLKIAFLAGFRHDLRNQFAIGKDHEPKSPLDFDRHAVNDTIAAKYQLELLRYAITTKAQGAKTI